MLIHGGLICIAFRLSVQIEVRDLNLNLVWGTHLQGHTGECSSISSIMKPACGLTSTLHFEIKQVQCNFSDNGNSQKLTSIHMQTIKNIMENLSQEEVKTIQGMSYHEGCEDRKKMQSLCGEVVHIEFSKLTGSKITKQPSPAQDGSSTSGKCR